MPKFASAVTGLFMITMFCVDSASSQGIRENSAPICQTKPIVIDNSAANQYIDSLNMSPLSDGYCMDPDGDELIVTSVAAPGKLVAGNTVVVPYPEYSDQAVTVAFVVSDTKGGQTTATLSLVRR